MSVPVFVCEIAFGYGPAAASPVWTDVSSYLRGFHIVRGKQYELNAYQAGTCDITLRNTDRRFDPTNTAGPYYPNVLPMVPVRISATFQSTTYRLFTGYVERYPQTRTGPTYAETVIQAVDGFELLSNASLPGATYPQELSGTRVSRVLDAAGWSSTARDIATGISNIPAYTFTDADGIVPLTHLQDVEAAELGNLFISNDGRVKYQDRHTSTGASQATFTDQPSVDTGAIGYTDIVASLDKDLIYNDWRGTRSGGVMQEALDSASITSYFQRIQTRTPLLVTDTDVLNQMTFLLSQYKDPALRISRITVTPGSNTTAWTQVLARELNEQITVNAHPPGGGATLTQASLIASIDLTLTTDAVAAQCVYGLLPASTVSYWQASISAVGSTTRAGY